MCRYRARLILVVCVLMLMLAVGLGCYYGLAARRTPNAPVTVIAAALSEQVKLAEEAIAASDAVGIAAQIGAEQATSNDEAGRVVLIARVILVSVAVEQMAKLSMKVLMNGIDKTSGAVSRKARAYGAVGAALVLADTLYTCLAERPWEQTNDDACKDQGMMLASTVTGIGDLHRLAKQGRKMTRLASRSTRILRSVHATAKLAERAAGASAKLSAKLAQKLSVKIGAALQRFSIRMGKFAAKTASKLALKLGTKVAVMAPRLQAEASLGPAGIAIVVVELTFAVVNVVLDMMCIGDFSEDCHVQPEMLEEISRNSREIHLLAIEASDLADLVLEVPTPAFIGYKEARKYYTDKYTKNPVQMKQLLGESSVAAWFLSMETSDMTPVQAMDKIEGLSEFLNRDMDTAVYTLASEVPCKTANGRLLGGRLLGGSVCTAKRDACFTYINAASDLFGPQGKAFSDPKRFAWLQLSVFFGSSARYAVDMHMGRSVPYGDDIGDLVAKCIRGAQGRVASFYDAMAALRAADETVADDLDGVFEPSDWDVVADSFAARAQWAHENGHVRRESFRWIPQDDGGNLLYMAPTEAKGYPSDVGLCMRDAAASMGMHVCPFIVASTRLEGKLDYNPVTPGHALNWKTGACTRTFEYCNEYNFAQISVDGATLGNTLTSNVGDPVIACSASDDRRAACTCGHTDLQKFGAIMLGDTLIGAVRSKINGG
jgi:hypothetical protein